MLAFSMGDLQGKGWMHLSIAAPMLVMGLGMLWLHAPALNMLLSGEREAEALGLAVRKIRPWLITWCAVLVAAAVSVGGSIAFVGLIVPHFMRRLLGPQHGWLIPSCAIGGAIFVLLCDSVSLLLPSQWYIPAGALSGIVGAPLLDDYASEEQGVDS